MAVKFVKLPASMSVYYKIKMTNQFYKVAKSLTIKIASDVIRNEYLAFIFYLFIIPAKARDYGITGVGLSVCLFVCLLPR